MGKKQKNAEDAGRKLICENRQARHRYEVLSKVEAGIQLTGSEVKACRMGRAHLSESYARMKGDELFLLGAHIGPYPAAGPFQHDPLRTRKLLLHRTEIERLRAQAEEKGHTLVPLRFYFSPGGRAKVELAVARGKKLYDRREEIARRESERQMRRAVKTARGNR